MTALRGTAFQSVRALVLALTLVFATTAHADPPDVKSLYPLGVQRGETTKVRVVGKLGTRPVAVWTSSDAITVDVPDEGDTIEITAGADVPTGIHWLRLHNAAGASSLRPFVVGSLPEVEEKETNDSLEKANEVDAGGVVANGVLAKNGDVDSWAVSLKHGQTLVAALAAHHDLGSPMDAVLQIVDDRGFVLDQNDDTRGNDPRLVFACPRDGRYLVRVFAFPETPTSSIRLAGGEDFVYRLTLTTGPYVDHVVPLAVSRTGDRDVEPRGWNLAGLDRRVTVLAPIEGAAHSTFAPADPVDVAVVDHPSLTETQGSEQPLDLPVTITGHVAVKGEIDEFSFRASKGDQLRLRVASRELGFPLDASIELLDEAGKSLKVVDDPKRNEYDPVLPFDVPADGTYRVRIRDVYEQFGTRHAYRLTIERRQPDFSLQLAGDRLTVEAGKSVKVPVTVERAEKFEGSIEFRVDGLPEGVQCASVTSDAKGDTKTKVELELTADADAMVIGGPVRIVGSSVVDEAKTDRVASAPNVRGRTGHVWLSVTAKK